MSDDESKDLNPEEQLLKSLVEKQEDEEKECCDPRSWKPQYILLFIGIAILLFFLVVLIFSAAGICDKLHGRTFLCRVNRVQPSGYSVLIRRNNDTDGRLIDSFALTPDKLSPDAIPFECTAYKGVEKDPRCEYQVGNVGYISMWSDGSVVYIYSGARSPSQSFIDQKATWCDGLWTCIGETLTGPGVDLVASKPCVESYIAAATVNGAHSYRELDPGETCDRSLLGIGSIPTLPACSKDRWDDSDFIFLAILATIEVNQCNCGSVLTPGRCIPGEVAELDAIYNQRTVPAGQRPPREVFG